MINEIIKLTKIMVNIQSVNNTPGEREIGIFIENYLRKIPYFKNHPERVMIQELENDPLKRRNVFAFLIGEKEKKQETIILHGHTDTVGIDDFNSLKGNAFSPDELMENLKNMDLPEEVRDDLLSGEYIFGRGSCDMKSGNAVFMVMFKHLSENVNQLSGNILVSFNPVEENLHTGIIEGCNFLEELKRTYNLKYILAINNDYTCPMYKGDPNRYIYTGVVGKLLPCFYIQGLETHVGQCFEGFDPTMTATELVRKINLSPEFCDGYEGEYSLPPVALKVKDLKEWYDVQTPHKALVYFNYFVHNEEMDSIVNKLIDAGKCAFENTLAEINKKYKAFCELTGKSFTKIEHEYEVITYEMLLKKVKSSDKGKTIDEKLLALTKEAEKNKIDKREIPVVLIREMLSLIPSHNPMIVLYFAAPYCPHNTLQDGEEYIVKKIRKIAGEVEKTMNTSYRICRFFPSLSDSSYLKIDDSKESLELLKGNFPQMDYLYNIPIDRIKKLNIPAVNFGVYGKDAHKWTERVNISYSFKVLPELISKTIEEFLGG